MELWIRSKNKYILIKTDFIYIEPVSTKKEDGYYIKAKHGINNGYSELTLGHYKTEERALEVLDEIHQRLIDLGTLEIAPNSYIILPKDTSNVYEMPK